MSGSGMERRLWLSRSVQLESTRDGLDLRGGPGFVVDALMASFHPPSVYLFYSERTRRRHRSGTAGVTHILGRRGSISGDNDVSVVVELLQKRFPLRSQN